MASATGRNGVATQTKKSVFLVDDHPIVRRGVADLISAEPDLEVSGEASSLAEAYTIVGQKMPHIALIDISLDGASGLELMKEFAYRWASLPLLAYSMHDEEVYAERVLRAGARGYVAKQSPPEELLVAIHAVLDGKVYLSERMSSRLLGKMVGVGKTIEPEKSPVEKLSDRELEVFQYLGKGLTTTQIAEAMCLSVKTVETYREHLKQKLDIKSGPLLIRFAIEWALQQP
jgi:DNA-binding NarL/FixJ family response regulator